MQHEAIALPAGDSVRLTVGTGTETLLTLTDWLASGTNREASAGVLVTTGEDHRALEHQLDGISVIAIQFLDATDGRGFSQARAIREWGFQGELRAAGDFNRDQLHFLRRCGFDSFDLPDKIDPEGAARCLHDFSVRYQTVCDEERPIHFRLR